MSNPNSQKHEPKHGPFIGSRPIQSFSSFNKISRTGCNLFSYLLSTTNTPRMSTTSENMSIANTMKIGMKSTPKKLEKNEKMIQKSGWNVEEFVCYSYTPDRAWERIENFRRLLLVKREKLPQSRIKGLVNIHKNPILPKPNSLSFQPFLVVVSLRYVRSSSDSHPLQFKSPVAHLSTVIITSILNIMKMSGGVVSSILKNCRKQNSPAKNNNNNNNNNNKNNNKSPGPGEEVMGPVTPHLPTVPEEDNKDLTTSEGDVTNNSNNNNNNISNQNENNSKLEDEHEDRVPSLGFSPGVFLSPPTLASTPSVPSRFGSLHHLFHISPSGGIGDFLRESGGRRPQRQHFPLTEFPLLVLDNIFSFLEDKDLRRFHQVSKAWKATLESRAGDNRRRLDLVRRIRENKENMLNGSKEQPTPDSNRVNRERVSDKKSEDLILFECTNLMNASDASSTKENTTGNSQLTPTSRFPFQSFEEAERSLKKGQKLFRCRRCSGPVPSPILAGAGLEEEKQEKCKIEATRCRLTSRMGDLNLTPVTPEGARREKKKTRVVNMSMPPPLSPIDIPTTVVLSERMNESLVISSPAAFRRNDEVKNTPSSMGIDLHMSGRSDLSSIDIKLNFTNSFDTSFSNLLSPPSFDPFKDSQHSVAESYMSDGEISANSFESKFRNQSSLFPNLIPSPEAAKILSPFFKNLAVEKDLLKPNTLNVSSGGLVVTSSKDHDKYDINDSSTYESHSINSNDIKSLHDNDKSLIICGDKERQTFTELVDVSRSLLPSLSLEGANNKSSRSTSDYFSSCGSVLRDASKSYFSDISTGRYDLVRRSLDESAICKSQSLGDIIDIKDRSSKAFSESSVSCPDLNESFVLECPNPNCSFRFCSTCSMAEHTGRPCRIISSESFEELIENVESKFIGRINPNKNQNKSNKGESLGKGKGKNSSCNSSKDKGSKNSLRRIAKL